MSEEYWIISVPGKPTPIQSFDEVSQATSRDQLSVNYLFHIPDLKVLFLYDCLPSMTRLFFLHHRLVHSIHSLHYRMI